MYSLGVFIAVGLLVTAAVLYEDKQQDDHGNHCHQIYSGNFLWNKDFIFVQKLQQCVPVY